MYDLVIIGAGWAGYNACLRAKELNLKVALIEKAAIGGTCLNFGCLPTKALIHSAKIFGLVKKSSDFGINCLSPALDFIKIQERKNKIVESLRAGMQFMLKGVDLFTAEAKIVSAQEIDINGAIIKTKFILLATGSMPAELEGFKFDGRRIISSNEALSLKEIPPALLIIGGGVIGCEFAGLFSGLGAEVTIIERMPQLLPGEDREISRKLEGIFKKRGITVNTGIDNIKANPDNPALILICVGRNAQGNIPGLKEAGVILDKGRIITDDTLKTKIDNIYAAGDCTSKVMLAHFAGYQGRLAVENIFGQKPVQKTDSLYIPNCIFTDPEIASVGLNEDMVAKESANIDKFDFKASGMARLLDETQGFLKIISDKKNGRVLGASIIGPKATEIIGILTLAVSCRLTVEQLRSAVFAHPTISESIGEALKYRKL